MKARTLYSCAAILLLMVSPSAAYADEGTGLDRGRGLELMNIVLGTDWTNSLEDHPDTVEDLGIAACADCHEPGVEGYKFGAPGCLTCHDREWDDDGDSDSDAAVELSAGNLWMNFMLDVDWPRPLENHRDYVEDFGIATCGDGCHAFDEGGKPLDSTFSAPGCLSCHDQKWDDGDGDGDSDSD